MTDPLTSALLSATSPDPLVGRPGRRQHLVRERLDVGDGVRQRRDEVLDVGRDRAVLLADVQFRGVDGRRQVAVLGVLDGIGQCVDETLELSRLRFQFVGLRLELSGVRLEARGHLRDAVPERARHLVVQGRVVEVLARERVRLPRGRPEVRLHVLEGRDETRDLVVTVAVGNLDVLELARGDVRGRGVQRHDGLHEVALGDEVRVRERDRGQCERRPDSGDLDGPVGEHGQYRHRNRAEELQADRREHLPFDRPVSANQRHRPPEEVFVGPANRHARRLTDSPKRGGR
nr:hypothetical protein [Halobacterium bonnevillei]